MSDPVTNAEIEDVLSSIRRLVSEEPLRDRADRKDSDAAPEKFVLTPALRVTEDDQPEDPGPRAERDVVATLYAEPDTQPEAEAAADAEPEMADPEAEAKPEAKAEADEASQQDAEWQADDDDEHDLSELAGEPVTDDQPEDIAEDHAGETPENQHQDDLTEDADVMDQQAAQDTGLSPDMTLEQRIAQLEAAIQRSPGEWEPDGSEDGSSDETQPIGFDSAGVALAVGDDASPEETAEKPHDDAQPESGDLSAADAGQDLAEPEHAEPDTAEATDNFDPDQFEEALAEEPDTEPAAPEATEEDTSDASPEQVAAMFRHAEPDQQTDTEDEQAQTEDWQDLDEDDPDATEADPDFSTAEEAEFVEDTQDPANDPGDEPDADTVEAPQTAEPQLAAKGQPEDPGTSGDDQSEQLDFYGDEGMIDEEALRELVSDLVRQELQGVLGERITRNVRRLVRREIQRAMAVRDFE